MGGDAIKMSEAAEGMIDRLDYKDQVRIQRSGGGGGDGDVADVATAQAVLVPAGVVSGVVVAEAAAETTQKCSRRSRVLILMGAGALVVAAAVGGSLAATTKSDTPRQSNSVSSFAAASHSPIAALDSPTAAPTTPNTSTSTPTASPTVSRNTTIQNLLLSVYDPGDMPMAEDSPQQQAQNWLLSDQDKEETLVSDARMLTRYALAVLYYATNGERWDFQVNFAVPNRHECDWNVDAAIGTRCDSTGNLVSIKMPNNSLFGSIPTEIGLLTTLNVLQLPGAYVGHGNVNVASNILTGTLPTEIGNLKKLIQLDLSGTAQLEGTIPTEIASLDKLVELRLSDNDFTGAVPSVIGAMSSLTFANFDYNDLTELPAALRTIPCVSARGNYLIACALFDVRRRSLQVSGSSQPEGCFTYTPPCELPSST